MRRPSSGSIARPLVALAMLASALVPCVEAQTARQFSYAIKGRRLDAADNVLRVTKGDVVEIAFASDEACELHLHGYDIKLDLAPGTPGAMRFAATIAGRFPLEAHGFGSGAARRHVAGPLLYLEVLPR